MVSEMECNRYNEIKMAIFGDCMERVKRKDHLYLSDHKVGDMEFVVACTCSRAVCLVSFAKGVAFVESNGELGSVWLWLLFVSISMNISHHNACMVVDDGGLVFRVGGARWLTVGDLVGELLVSAETVKPEPTPRSLGLLKILLEDTTNVLEEVFITMKITSSLSIVHWDFHQGVLGVPNSVVGVGASPAFSKSSLSEVGSEHASSPLGLYPPHDCHVVVSTITTGVGLNTGVGGVGDDIDSLYISCGLVLLAAFLDRKYFFLPAIVVPYRVAECVGAQCLRFLKPLFVQV
ncbi:hypothetical protein VNO77_01556 [Canavalia gladiata]|uniref:Uncharacterized protein n=1 Tax=Canavalia gladiata TaxID=3824 RepID=A0AAN9MRF9_CANGL